MPTMELPSLDPGETEGVEINSAETFLELHMHQEPMGSVQDVKEEDTQVILIYQDVLTCGVCNKQYVELTDFLYHKTQHTIGDTEYFKCEICKVVFNSSESLLEHYDSRHQVPLTSDEEALLPPSELKIEEQNSDENEDSIESHDVDDTDEMTAHPNEMLSTSGAESHETIDISEETDSGETADMTNKTLPQKCTENHGLKLDSYRQQLSLERSNDEVRDNNNMVKGSTDFTFVLVTETVKGSSFTYGRTWFKCLHCKFKTAGKLCMIRHMRDKHSDMIGLHQNIQVKDKNQDEHYKVMRMSTYDASYLREKRFRRRQNKRQPLEKRDKIGRFPCDKCQKVFSKLRYLRKHVETHRTEKMFLCDVCNKSFKSRTYLTIHKKVHKAKMFKCNQCDFTSNVNAAIHAHRQVHSQGSVLCDICGFAYTDKATLTKHKRVHDVTRPYACTYPGCTWRFKTEIMCRAHYRAHTIEGKFKCSQCGYAFRQKHHLQRHEMKIHGIQQVKSRSSHPALTTLRESDQEELADTVHLVVNSADGDLQFRENGLVVATPITLEADLLNVAYQTLLQTHNKHGNDSQTILLTQPDSHIIFQQE